MFSNHIHHNKTKLENNQNNFYIIPFGQRCSIAMACIHANLRKFSLPFDWTIPLYPKNIKYILKNKFKYYIPDVFNDNFINIYNIRIAHFNINKKEGIEQYKRRIQRFNNIMMDKNKIIYFIYLNDDYIVNEKYRNRNFNKNMYEELLNLELFIKQLYPNLKFKILYFDFVYHKIPKYSNIILIELKFNKKIIESKFKQRYSNIIKYTDKSEKSSSELNKKLERFYFKKLRQYIGYVLSEMFGTKFDKYVKFNSD